MSSQLEKISKICKRAGNFVLALTRNKPEDVFYAADFNEKRKLDLFVVTFNDPKLLEWQYRFMRKNLSGRDYHYIVCDNSSNKTAAEEIFSFCRTHNITCFRLPKFLYIGPSHSHGYALNWIYKHIIRKRENNFAFIDHDVFPICQVDLGEYQEKPLCGVWRNWHNYKYPWVAFSFYKYDFMCTRRVNFLPCRYKGKHLDTGGANYKAVYKDLKAAQVGESTERYIDVRTGKNFIRDKKKYKNWDDDVYENAVELIDGKWLHIIGGAQWNGKHNKFERALKMFV